MNRCDVVIREEKKAAATIAHQPTYPSISLAFIRPLHPSSKKEKKKRIRPLLVVAAVAVCELRRVLPSPSPSLLSLSANLSSSSRRGTEGRGSDPARDGRPPRSVADADMHSSSPSSAAVAYSSSSPSHLSPADGFLCGNYNPVRSTSSSCSPSCSCGSCGEFRRAPRSRA